jgi:hypothetical protein
MMVHFFKMLGTVTPVTQHHIPEELNQLQYMTMVRNNKLRCSRFNSYKIFDDTTKISESYWILIILIPLRKYSHDAAETDHLKKYGQTHVLLISH